MAEIIGFHSLLDVSLSPDIDISFIVIMFKQNILTFGYLFLVPNAGSEDI